MGARNLPFSVYNFTIMNKKINTHCLLPLTKQYNFFMTIKIFLAKLKGDLQQCRFNPY